MTRSDSPLPSAEQPDAGVTPAAPADERVETSQLPSALDRLGAMITLAANRRVAVFLDYDGTLTPIVARPEDAVLSKPMRRVLRRLARRVSVTIVSGRDLRDVQQLVAVEGLLYAGSHGFEIVGPQGQRLDAGRGDPFLPALDRAEAELRSALNWIPGAFVERKRFTVAAHYRLVPVDRVSAVAVVVDEVAARHSDLRRAEGKRVFELQPRLDWDKGKAVHCLLQAIAPAGARLVPLYIGDDLTDEDAFRAIAADGIPVVVRDESRPTAARYALDGTAEVQRFLERLSVSPLVAARR